MTHRPIISMTERNSRVHHPSAIRATATFSSNRSATVNPFFRSFTSYIVPSSLADWSLTQPTRIRHISSTYALCHWSISRATRYYKIFPLFFSLPDDTRYSLRSNRECYELSRIGDTKKKREEKYCSRLRSKWSNLVEYTLVKFFAVILFPRTSISRLHEILRSYVSKYSIAEEV